MAQHIHIHLNARKTRDALPDVGVRVRITRGQFADMRGTVEKIANGTAYVRGDDGKLYPAQVATVTQDDLVESSSKEALKKNIETEIGAGKNPKQAAAIAYSVQRENKG